MKISDIPVNSVFIDNNTLYNSEPIEWYVAAHNVDGNGITTLMKKTPLTTYIIDAKEPQNPNEACRNGGYGEYDKSNLLQWFNSDGLANEWYVAQHTYDYPPNNINVGGTYLAENGFLHDFGNSLCDNLREVEKNGAVRKVHYPSYTELVGTDVDTQSAGVIYDDDGLYQNFNGASLYKQYCTVDWSSSSSTKNQYPNIAIRSSVDTSIESWAANTGRLYYWAKKGSGTIVNRWTIVNMHASLGTSTAEGLSYILNVIPVVYVSSGLPVEYNPSTSKYYLADYGISTKYSDYGTHKKGFDFEIKIDSGDTTGTATVSAYIDNSTTAVKTFSVSTYNEFTSLTFNDNDLSSLSLGNHTVSLKCDKDGAFASTSFVFQKSADTIPVILSNVIGHVVEVFTTTYQVYDEDGDDLDVTVKIDNVVVDTQTDVTQHVDLSYTITSALFTNLTYGNHTLTIEVTDGVNTTTDNIVFTKNSLPELTLNIHDLGEVTEPVSVVATYSSADGDEIAIKAYIDGQEITT